MKKSNVSVANLLEQLSEEQINLAVEGSMLVAGGYPNEGGCGSPCGGGENDDDDDEDECGEREKEEKCRKEKKEKEHHHGCGW